MASCKPIVFEFSISEKVLYKKISDLIKKNKGDIIGNEKTGTFFVPVPSFGGVEGDYRIDNNKIILTIKKKPIILSCMVIASFFKRNFPRVEKELDAE